MSFLCTVLLGNHFVDLRLIIPKKNAPSVRQCNPKRSLPSPPLDHNRSGSECLELLTYLQETNNVIGLRSRCFLFVRRSKLITFDYKLYVDLWSEKMAIQAEAEFISRILSRRCNLLKNNNVFSCWGVAGLLYDPYVEKNRVFRRNSYLRI